MSEPHQETEFLYEEPASAAGPSKYATAIIGSVLVVLAILGGLHFGLSGMRAGTGSGTKFTHFVGETPGGTVVDTEDFKGQVIVVDFWASWCPPCVAKMPTLVALQEEYKDEGVQVIGVNLDADGPTLTAAEERFGINFPSIRRGADKVAEHYGVRSIPTVLVINRDGKIIFRGHGGNLESLVKKAL